MFNVNEVVQQLKTLIATHGKDSSQVKDYRKKMIEEKVMPEVENRIKSIQT